VLLQSFKYRPSVTLQIVKLGSNGDPKIHLTGLACKDLIAALVSHQIFPIVYAYMHAALSTNLSSELPPTAEATRVKFKIYVLLSVLRGM
jgi:hypothetical protein